MDDTQMTSETFALHDFNDYSTTNTETVSFVRQNFFAKECTHFAPHRGKLSLARFPNENVCHCGGSSKEHDSTLQKKYSDTKWNKNDIEKLSTNAFGKVSFIGTDKYQKPAKFIRLAEDSDIDNVMTLLKEHWHLASESFAPELIVSVLGNGKALNIPDSLKKKIFNRGLIPAINATKGWITTFGSNIGVAKAVGDAVREGQCLWDEDGRFKRSIQCIGISMWGAVKKRSLLLNSQEELKNQKIKHAEYPVDVCRSGDKVTCLNPHHTHFLLVDDGFRNKDRGVENFRARVEQKISAPIEDGGLGVPVVCILVGGGPSSIEYLASSVGHGLPALICEGSGRAADLVAYAYKHYRLCRVNSYNNVDQSDFRQLKCELRDQIQRIFFSSDESVQISRKNSENLTDKVLEELVQICQNTKLIYVTDVTRNESLDTAILLCLMECRGISVKEQLHLALNWDRADVAKAKIFSSGHPWTNEDLHVSFTDALIKNQLDFIKLFVDYGFSVKQYLTIAQLQTIYTKSVTEQTLLYRLLNKSKKQEQKHPLQEIKLVEIYNVMQDLTRRFCHEMYTAESSVSKCFDKPFQELFLWATLLNRIDLALYFWEQCVDPLLVVVSGTYVSACLAEEAFGAEMTSQYLDMKSDFESTAVALIKEAFKTNREKSLALIGVNSKVWGNINTMELAAVANDQDFLATSCCQLSTFLTWKCGYEANGWEIVACFFTILPIFTSVQFTDESVTKKNEYSRTMRDYLIADVTDGLGVHYSPYHQQARRTVSSAPSEDYRLSFAVARKSRVSETIDMPDKQLSFPRKKLHWWQKLYKFYTSAAVKFTSHSFWYLFYLVLFSYVLLFSFRPSITVPEMVLHFWTLTYFCEIIRSIATYRATTTLFKLQNWWYYSSFAVWNRLELVCIFLSVWVFVFRWFSVTFVLSRLLLALAFIFSMCRIYKVFMVSSYLGPKVVMIKKMSKELLMFLLLVGVMMIAYSVSSQALLHPNRSFYTGIFYDIFNHGIWELFGELDEEVTQGHLPECSNLSNSTLFGYGTDCSLRLWPTALLLAIYLFFGNVLLVNMLIAIFASIFDEVQSHSEQLWKSLMYYLVNEYHKKPILPPPFIIFEHIYIFICWLRCSVKKDYTPVEKQPTNTDATNFLSVFELVCRGELLEKQKQANTNPVDLKLTHLDEKIEKMKHTLEEAAKHRAPSLAMPMALPMSAFTKLSDFADTFSETNTDDESFSQFNGEDEPDSAAPYSQSDILFH